MLSLLSSTCTASEEHGIKKMERNPINRQLLRGGRALLQSSKHPYFALETVLASTHHGCQQVGPHRMKTSPTLPMAAWSMMCDTLSRN